MNPCKIISKFPIKIMKRFKIHGRGELRSYSMPQNAKLTILLPQLSNTVTLRQAFVST